MSKPPPEPDSKGPGKSLQRTPSVTSTASSMSIAPSTASNMSIAPSTASTMSITPLDVSHSYDVIHSGIASNHNIQPKTSSIQLSKKIDSDHSSSTSVGSAGSGSIARPNLKRKDVKAKKKIQKIRQVCSSFWIRFSCMFLSRIFLRHRNIVFLLIEVFMPIAIAAGIVAAFTSGSSWKDAYYEKDMHDSSPQTIKFVQTDMTNVMARFTQKYADKDGRVLILYSPTNNLTEVIMRGAMKELNIQAKNSLYTNGDSQEETISGVLGFSTEIDILGRALLHRHERKRHGKPIGVVFLYDKNMLDKTTGFPHMMSFSIRHFEESISDTGKVFPYVKPNRSPKSTSPYIQTGFLGLQYAIQLSYLKLLDTKINEGNEISSDGKLIVRQFYFPNFYNHDVRTMVTFTTCMCIVTAYLFTSFFILKQLVLEKRSKIKELLSMHGMSTYLHWLILFVHALLFRGITAGIMTFVLNTSFGNGKIIALADLSLIFVILWLHLVALTFFNFFLASVMESATYVGPYATIIGLVSFMAPVTFYNLDIIERIGNFILSIIFPNWTLYNIIHHIINFEYDDKRVTWNNMRIRMDDSHTASSYLTIFEGLLVLAASAIFYFILATYFDLQSNMYSTPLHWWNVIAMRKQRKENRIREEEMLQDIKAGNKHNFEKPAIYEEPAVSKKKCYVRVRHLCKRYGKHNMALDTVNLDIYHEEITVILGHGGSGKSSLVSILAGLINPTAGYATIKNHDVFFEAHSVRKYIGLCAQTLIYYNLLSVRQHLYLCYRLRGYIGADCTRNSSTLLTRLRLWNIRNSFPDTMTKDELRRLNIAMAMADSPKVLLLDEPTTFCDAFGRREIWNILKLLKRHHTIIVATNYMDEAEYLSDKIALLSHGRLICYGSVEFLKKRYDTGYFLRCQPFNDVKLDSQEILNIVRKSVGEKAVEQKNSSIKEVDNIIIELPIVDYLKFANLCQDFEQNQVKLGIKRYSFKQIGLNDIFIKICESISTYNDAPDLYVRRDSAGDIRTALTTQIPHLPDTGRYSPNCKSQFSALLHKRFTYLLTQHDFFVWQLLIPIIMISIVMFETKVFVVHPIDAIPRNLTLDGFGKVEVLTKTTDDNENYVDNIKNVLGRAWKDLPPSQDILQTLRKLIEHKKGDLGAIKERHMTALEFNSKHGSTFDFTGFYASGALHSAPVILSTMMNIVLSSLTDPRDPKYVLFPINNPMPLTNEYWSVSHQSCGLLCAVFAILLSFALGYISSSTTIFPMMERRMGIKHIQLMTGVPPWLYWLSNFVCDAGIMLFVTAIVGIVLSVERSAAFGGNAIVVFMCITALYLAWSGLAFSYFASYVIPLRFRGFTFMIMFHMLSLLLFLFVEYIKKSSYSAGRTLRIVFMIFPGFAVTCGIQDWFNAVSRRSFCKGLHPHVKQACKGPSSNPLPTFRHFNGTLYDHIMKTDVRLGQCCEKICKPKRSCYVEPGLLNAGFEDPTHPGLITDIVALTLTGLIFWVLLLLAERRFTNRFSQKVVAHYLNNSDHGRKLTNAPTPSDDVKQENVAVRSIINEEIIPDDTAMVISGLTKCRSAKVLLNNFNLQIKKGDCVGILGAGGSGKTTLIRLIAGIDTPTKGMCYFQDSSLVRHRKKYLESIGYCPEDNTLFDKFTGIQMLELMGRLRGIPKEILSSHVAKWLLVVGLTEIGQDKCGGYGLDMKRRLCCAMALIGQCPILLLDEATTGVGPLGRERFWAILEHLKELGHTIIFTTFHTEECVKLSTKLVVLAEGNAQCLGKPDDIKQRFAKGYCLTFRLKHEILTRIDITSLTMGRIVEFKRAIKRTFGSCDLIDEQDNLLMYFLRDPKIFWGEVFRRMHALVTDFSYILTSYDVTEASIDELFILLTSKYREMGIPRQIDEKKAKELSKEDAEVKALEASARALHMKI